MHSVYTKIILAFLVLLFSVKMQAQEQNNFNYLVSLNSGISSDEALPFWLVSNRYGAVPNSDFLALNAALFSNFKKPDKNFGIAYKVSATGYLATENTLLINEMYLRLQFKNWAFDIGNVHDAVKWNGLSSSNGNIVKSINSRAYPGLNIRTLEYIKLPFAKKWLKFQMNFSNYWLNDERYVDNANLHHSSLFLKFKLSPKFELIAGLDHYAQWAGTSPTTGKQPNSFKDFIKIVFGQSGGSSSNVGDQLNALGNHLGAYLLQANYKADNTTLNFYYSHPFEDGSGMELQNWMDGIYGFFVDFKKPEALVNSVLAEFTYTKNMSGENPPDRYDDEGNRLPGRGLDNYFNNGVYNSGWTYFGRTIGSPYFTTKPVDENGITNGVIIGDNRFMAFNVGVKGTLKPVKYKVMLSHVTYFGWFEREYEQKPTQFSGLFEAILPQDSYRIPFEISAAFSFDTGTYQPVNFGGFITLTRRGLF